MTQNQDDQALKASAIVERLVKVEKQNRRLRLTAIGLFLLVAAGTLVGATTPKSTDYSASDFRFRSVRAEELRIDTKTGTVFVGMRGGDLQVALKSKNNHPSVGLTVSEVGAGLKVCDEKGRTRAVLALTTDSKTGPLLIVFDTSGNPTSVAPSQ